MGKAVWPTEHTDNTERIGKIRMKFMVRAFREVANGPFNGQIRDLQIHRRVLTEAELRATWVSKTDLFAQADHVVLVLPYSPAVHHTVGAAELALMKPTATLTNIARGGVVDDAALAEALRAGQLAAAGLDVFEGEPQVHPALLEVPNVVLTPHIASATMATRLKMAQLAADNLIAFFEQGRAITPLNEVKA